MHGYVKEWDVALLSGTYFWKLYVGAATVMCDTLVELYIF